MSAPEWSEVVGSVTRTELGTDARGRIWQSTLTKALFRWTDNYYEDGTGTWEAKTANADWHPAYQGGIQTMYSRAGEKFMEVTW